MCSDSTPDDQSRADATTLLRNLRSELEALGNLMYLIRVSASEPKSVENIRNGLKRFWRGFLWPSHRRTASVYTEPRLCRAAKNGLWHTSEYERSISASHR